jgi:ubiquinone/menaquinone biosynthesis C-methylase UbiE
MAIPQKDPEGFERQHLLDFADFTEARVLEIGCGDGRLTWKYAAASRLTFGLDPDFEQLHLARADCPSALRGRVHFACASAYHIPLPTEIFDIAILSWSL